MLTLLAVTETQGLLLQYFSDLRTKLLRQKGKKKSTAGVNITAAIESNLKISEKGQKPNEMGEIGKKAMRQSKKSSSKESHSSTCKTKPMLTQNSSISVTPSNQPMAIQKSTTSSDIQISNNVRPNYRSTFQVTTITDTVCIAKFAVGIF